MPLGSHHVWRDSSRLQGGLKPIQQPVCSSEAPLTQEAVDSALKSRYRSMVEELGGSTRGSSITVCLVARDNFLCLCQHHRPVDFMRAGAIDPALQMRQKRSNRNPLPVLTLRDQAREEQKHNGLLRQECPPRFSEIGGRLFGTVVRARLDGCQIRVVEIYPIVLVYCTFQLL